MQRHCAVALLQKKSTGMHDKCTTCSVAATHATKSTVYNEVVAGCGWPRDIPTGLTPTMEACRGRTTTAGSRCCYDKQGYQPYASTASCCVYVAIFSAEAAAADVKLQAAEQLLRAHLCYCCCPAVKLYKQSSTIPEQQNAPASAELCCCWLTLIIVQPPSQTNHSIHTLNQGLGSPCVLAWCPLAAPLPSLL
jgi:hypothetical protein